MKDILKVHWTEHKVKIENGHVAAFRAKDITRTGARLFTGGLVASASQVGPVSEGVLFEKCLAHKDAALPAEGIPTGSAKKSWDVRKKGNPGEIALAAAKEHIALLGRELPNFIAQGQITVSSHEVAYTNELGADLRLAYDDFSFVYDLRRKGSPNIADAFLYHSDQTGFYSREDLGWQIELLRTFDQEVKISAGKKKVLMLPDARALGKVAEGLRADMYWEGTALYSKRLGEKIFSEKFSLSDLRWVPELGGLKPFDFEGNLAPSDRVSLLERGTLKALISDLRNEARHKVASTANGFRDYSSSVRLGFSHLAVEPGKRGFREILRDAGEVIVSCLTSGGDLTAQGDFSTPVQLAFLVRDGQVVGKLPALSIFSHIEKMFGADLLEVAANGPTKHSGQPYLLAEMDVQVI